MDDDYSSNNTIINEEFQQHPGLNPSPPLPPTMYLLCARYFTTRSVTFTLTWELGEIVVTLAVRKLRWAPVSTDGSVVWWERGGLWGQAAQEEHLGQCGP